MRAVNVIELRGVELTCGIGCRVLLVVALAFAHGCGCHCLPTSRRHQQLQTLAWAAAPSGSQSASEFANSRIARPDWIELYLPRCSIEDEAEHRGGARRNGEIPPQVSAGIFGACRRRANRRVSMRELGEDGRVPGDDESDGAAIRRRRRRKGGEEGGLGVGGA